MAKLECNELTSKMFRIYAISEALARGWDRLPPEMIEESLEGLKTRISDLMAERRISSPQPAMEVSKVIDKLEEANNVRGTISPFSSSGRIHPESPNVRDLLMPAVLKMATEGILDCGCREAGYVVQRDTDK